MHGLPLPSALRAEYPLSDAGRNAVEASRRSVLDILRGRDRRLLLIIGPCSIHDEGGAYAYADFLREQARAYNDRFFIVMRCYMEKSRTGEGWKGMARDPQFSGASGAAEEGLKKARRIMSALADSGLPLATELASPYLWPYWIDTVSWASIGARGVESQALRETAQLLPCPCGFKNGRDGGLLNALTAATIALRPGAALACGLEDGRPAETDAPGNPLPHVILRGSDTRPNWRKALKLERLMRAAGLPPAIIVDASHGNSGKNPDRQREVALGALRLRKRGVAIRGVMVESYLRQGRQDSVPGVAPDPELSLTDACLGLEESRALIAALAARA
jgi:3-deoxy-7-phosphoheptulonate synthase